MLKDKDVIKFNPKGGGADFVMHKNARSAWVTVDGVTVYIYRHDNLVCVELYPYKHEACCDYLESCIAPANAKQLADQEHRG